MTATKSTAAFDAAFNAWINDQGKPVLGVIDRELLRSIVGVFYHQGGVDAMREAREIVKTAGGKQ